MGVVIKNIKSFILNVLFEEVPEQNPSEWNMNIKTWRSVERSGLEMKPWGVTQGENSGLRTELGITDISGLKTGIEFLEGC